jgi:hypothetical protein
MNTIMNTIMNTMLRKQKLKKQKSKKLTSPMCRQTLIPPVARPEERGEFRSLSFLYELQGESPEHAPIQALGLGPLSVTIFSFRA